MSVAWEGRPEGRLFYGVASPVIRRSSVSKTNREISFDFDHEREYISAGLEVNLSSWGLDC